MLFKNSIPYCYFPTQVVVVDDDPLFLESLSLALGKFFHTRSFISPKEALGYLKEQAQEMTSWLNQPISEQDYQPSSVGVTVNTQFFKDIYYQNSRFDQSAVLVVDYSMPEMDGLAFCKALQDFPYQKILLTGNADNDFAVQAFNQGEIDRFLKKGQSNYIDKLTSYISSCCVNYFTDISNKLSHMLDPDNISLLRKKVFIEKFNALLSKYDIVEFYRIDEIGSYLLVDAEGKAMELIVKAEDDMQYFAEIALDTKDSDAGKVAKAIAERTHVPRLFSWEDKKVPASDWPLYQAHALSIDGVTYYYALTSKSTHDAASGLLSPPQSSIGYYAYLSD